MNETTAEERMKHYAPNEYGRYMNPIEDRWSVVDALGKVRAVGTWEHCLPYLDPANCSCGHKQYCGHGCGGHTE